MTTLDAGETLFRAILDSARDAVIVADRSGRIRLFNRTAEAMFGYKASEMLGQSVRLLMPLPYRDEHDGYLAAYQRTGVARAIGQIRVIEGQRRSGEVFPIELALSETLDGHEHLYSAVIRDVTEHMRERDVLLEIESRYRGLVEGTHDLVQTVDREGRILFVNRAWCLTLGYDLKEIQGLTTDDIIHPDSLELWMDVVDRIRHGESPPLIEATFVDRHGREVIVEGSVTVRRRGDEFIGTHGIFRDVGDRRRAERALRASEERLRVAQEVAHLGSYQLRAPFRSTADWSAEAYRMLGLDQHKRSITREEFDACVHPDDLAHVTEVGTALMRDGIPCDYEHRIVRPDGSIRTLQHRAEAIRDADGQVVRVVGTLLDVTERKEAEQENVRLQRLAMMRDRMAEIGAISTRIVHDVGNPLAGLAMLAQRILRCVNRGPKNSLDSIQGSAEQLLETANRLDDLIHEFKDFARDERLVIAEVDLGPLLTDVVAFWRTEAVERGIELVYAPPKESVTVSADESRLRRVFDNLIKNALEALDHGPGAVRLEIEIRNAATVARVSVEDSGPGIPPDVEVFGLFESTKPDGTGLGLPICRQIVIAHGGGIHFASVPPHGTVFHVDLPCGNRSSASYGTAHDRTSPFGAKTACSRVTKDIVEH